MASSLFQASLIFFPICLLAGLGGYFADQWLGPSVPLRVFIVLWLVSGSLWCGVCLCGLVYSPIRRARERLRRLVGRV